VKPKAKTLVQRFGFADPDLTSSEHDEIVLNLLSPQKMFLVLKKTVLKDRKCNTYIECEHRMGRSGTCVFEKKNSSCPFFRDDWREKIDSCPLNTLFKEEWNSLQDVSSLNIISKDDLFIKTEVAITTHTKYVVGFIDFKVTLHSDEIKTTLLRKEIDGTVNFLEKRDSHGFYLEIKPKVTSFGEVMRQLNMYREFCKGEFILITRTIGLKDAFESQGIHVYEWDE